MNGQVHAVRNGRAADIKVRGCNNDGFDGSKEVGASLAVRSAANTPIAETKTGQPPMWGRVTTPMSCVQLVPLI